MTKLFVCSVRDAAIETYIQPFTVAHRGAAIRDFMDQAKKPDSAIHAHAGDYDLYLLGIFDDYSGLFEANAPERLIRGADCVPGAGPTKIVEVK